MLTMALQVYLGKCYYLGDLEWIVRLTCAFVSRLITSIMAFRSQWNALA
jgi:hypothetical protein